MPIGIEDQRKKAVMHTDRPTRCVAKEISDFLIQLYVVRELNR